MKNGLYRAEFATPLGAGSGVVYLNDGAIHGGDSAMYYTGKYDLVDDAFTATVTATRHSSGVEGVEPVFGLDRVEIDLTGTFIGDTANTTGTSKDAPGVEFQAILSWLCD